jgi:hypothetical protein
MSFIEYVQNSFDDSFENDINFQEELSSCVSNSDGRFGMITIDPEIELIKYDKETQEGTIKVTWSAEMRSSYWEGVEPSGILTARVKIQSNGSQPAKFTLIECVDVDPTALI